MSYHETIHQIYREAAETPAGNLCCVDTHPLFLPDLVIPPIMHEMNYGCGSTVHLRDMKSDRKMLYVGVGGGLELLQLAYFSRRPGGVIGVDPVPEMRKAAADNLRLASEKNGWFDLSFVEIRDGDALRLPLDDASIDFAAQNCLFNVFHDEDLAQALSEMHRVLSRGGRLVMSDPITPSPLPTHLVDDERLRAQCLSGCQTLEAYLGAIVAAGFGVIEVRSRRPYRMLDKKSYQLDDDLLLESLEVAAVKQPVPLDGPCIFTGRQAIYHGPDEHLDVGNGQLLPKNVPISVCDKTGKCLESRPEVTVTPSTWHHQAQGCC